MISLKNIFFYIIVVLSSAVALFLTLDIVYWLNY